MKYKVQAFKLSNGERAALLVCRETGLPLIYQNLYTTVNHRNKSDSINTIKAVLRTLGFFTQLCEYLKIDLENRFAKGKLFTNQEIELISKWSKKSQEFLNEAESFSSSKNVISINSKRFELARHTVIIDMDILEPETTYARLTNLTKYSVWLANTFNVALDADVEKMKKKLFDKRPEKNSYDDNDKPFKSLTTGQKEKLLEIVKLDSPENIWKDEGVRFRNQLIIHILYFIGCRKGELLTLKATDFDPGKKTVNIRRDADNPDDPRADAPLVKTLSRDIEIDDELYEMVEDYIMKYRSKVKGANKTSYLFLSHQTGSTIANPLSIPSVDKIFASLSKKLGFNVHPHALRHSWNDDFSEMTEPFLASGEMSESEVEDLRSYLEVPQTASGHESKNNSGIRLRIVDNTGCDCE
ncbi:MAG: site-specific integrase, partial [Pseudomonadota bacterium]